MNDIHSADNAPPNSPVSEIIRRLSAGGNSNPIIRRLIEAEEEAHGVRLANALRAAKSPELLGQGTSYVFSDMITDRAEGQLEGPDNAVQRVALHGPIAADPSLLADRATVLGNRTNDGFPDPVTTGNLPTATCEIVQPLSDKNSRNNGCTVGSESQPASASRLASPDNVFTPPSSARSTRQDNRPCTASYPLSPVQEIIAEEMQPAEGTTELPDIPDASCSLPRLSPGYCRCDFFDNGASQTATGKGKRARARYRANLFIGSNKRQFQRFKLSFLSEPRYFKRSTPEGYAAFYERVWAYFDELREMIRANADVMSIAPVITHMKDEKNHVVPAAAAVLYQLEGEDPEVVLFLHGSAMSLQLDQKPKGSAKCAALKAIGYLKREK